MQSQQKSLRMYVLLLIVAILFSGCAAPAAPASAPAAASGSSGSTAAERPAAAAPASESARPASEPASSAPAVPSSHRSPTPAADANGQQRAEPVTAGVVDDNEQWNDYLDYRARHDYLWVNERDITERIAVQVWDQNNEPVHDATVEIFGDQQQVIFTGRTDAGGQLFFHPRAIDANSRVQTYFVTASKGFVAQRQQFSRQESRWTISLIDPPAAHSTQLDLLFLVDATGSMSDEIEKLTAKS